MTDAIINLLAQHGALTAADLATMTGYTPDTVYKALRGCDRVRIIGTVTQRYGRPALYALVGSIDDRLDAMATMAATMRRLHRSGQRLAALELAQRWANEQREVRRMIGG